MQTKSNPNIKQATFQAFICMPDEFRGFQLVRIVKMLTRRKYIHTDTPLRKLRVLRSEGKVNYKMALERAESLYVKI